MLDVGRFQIAKKLSNMFVGNRLGSFEFHHQKALNKKIGEKISEYCAVFIQHLNGVLLLDLQALFAESVSQCIFVNFFEVTVPMVKMDRVGRFPDNAAKLKDCFHVSLQRFVILCALLWLFLLLQPALKLTAREPEHPEQIDCGAQGPLAAGNLADSGEARAMFDWHLPDFVAC